MESASLPVIGRIVDVQFPEWEGVWMRAKVDTGATICSIHAEDIREEKHDDIRTLLFSLTEGSDVPGGVPRTIHCQSTEYVTKKIKSALGMERRFCVTAVLSINGKEYRAICGLSDRTDMKLPMLIGLKLIQGNFLVDLQQ